jgi:hypothetical protein
MERQETGRLWAPTDFVLELVKVRQHLGLKSASRLNVCFGSKGDIEACPRDVRFTPNSRH